MTHPPGSAARGAPRIGPAFALLAVAVVAIGVLRAIQHAWISDDAYISFRYARHLVHGLGLVFNAGERVEGYTNFLWTLWLALGIRLGVAPETWSVVFGIACYAGTLAILVFLARARARRLGIAAIPVAAALGAVHRDWAVFATSGLETSMLTLLVVGGYATLAVDPPGPRRAALAGALFALATLTRPDAVVFAFVAALYVLWAGTSRARAAAAFVTTFALLLLPWVIWKVGYYGDVFPNTYYAKSVHLAWYRQGFAYLALYAFKYWGLFAGFAVVLWVPWFRASAATASADDRREAVTVAPAALAATMVLVFMAYLARIGGDFMYARMMIPATPLLCVLFELASERVFGARPIARFAIAALGAIAILASPVPVTGEHWRRGIADEWDFYRHVQDRGAVKRSAERLRAFFRGLPVRVAFIGGQAILVDASDAPVAIESETGLTDAFIAHQPLAMRGRPGHEKHAPWTYLIDRRRAHLLLQYDPAIAESLSAYIPVVRVDLGDLATLALTWDPPVMDELARRGARFESFPARLDDYLDRMPALPDSVVARDYAKFRRFYFAGVHDPGREAPFRRRLGS